MHSYFLKSQGSSEVPQITLRKPLFQETIYNSIYNSTLHPTGLKKLIKRSHNQELKPIYLPQLWANSFYQPARKVTTHLGLNKAKEIYKGYSGIILLEDASMTFCTRQINHSISLQNGEPAEVKSLCSVNGTSQNPWGGMLGRIWTVLPKSTKTNHSG